MHNYAPRLFTNDSGSIFQYEDQGPNWRWGLLRHTKHVKLSVMDVQSKGQLVFLPPNWIRYAVD